MKRMGLIAAVLAVTVLGLAGVGSAGVDRLREEFVTDVAGTVEDGCDEPILMTAGRVVDTVQEHVDGSGTTHLLLRFHTFGLRGIGLDSGALYRDNSHGISTIMFGEELGDDNVSFSVHVRITSNDGNVADLAIVQRFHIVKRDGIRKVLLDSTTVTCG